MLLTALLVTTGCGIAREDPVIDDDVTEKTVDQTQLIKLDPGGYYQTWQMDDGRIVSFCISVPATLSDDIPVPLVLALHHGSGKPVQFFANEMVEAMIKPATLEMDPIIVAPDVINKSWINFRCEECVMALLAEICETYNIDRKRVLVIGYSLGAEGAWQYAGKYPDFFTASIPVSGHPPDDYLTTTWTVPMLVIHSTADEVFPFSAVSEAVKALEAREDGVVQIYPLEGISHYDSGAFIEPLKEAATWVQQVWDANASQNEP